MNTHYEKGSGNRRRLWRVVAIGLLLVVGAGLFKFFLLRERERTFSGIVVDLETGQPLKQAVIAGQSVVRDEFSPSLDGLFRKHLVYNTELTNSHGRFTFTLEGIYPSVKVLHSGYVAERIYCFSCQGYPLGESNKRQVGSGTPYLDASDPDNIIIRVEPRASALPQAP